jgi:uncharacterized protein (DUF952 family)
MKVRILFRIKFAVAIKMIFMMKVLSLFLFALLSLGAFAQVRKIPPAVTEAFARQYPAARDVSYRDMLTGYQVEFVLDSTNMIAKYTNKGEWKETEKDWDYDQLSGEVRDGFQKSKYANEWQVKETAIIYMPDGSERYRVKIEKNDVQKKYLFFDQKGRLIRDALTL